MRNKQGITDYLILGSGICGLTIANRISQSDKTVAVLDKGKAPGGRTATRRVDISAGKKAVFDYGAQYFTARNKLFIDEVQKWIDAGFVKEWSKGFYLEDGTFKADNEPRYIGVPNMRSIASHLSKRLEVIQSEKVININWTEQMWRITTENDHGYFTEHLVLTCPLPQSLELLSNSSIHISKETEHRLKEIKYDRCIAIMLICGGPGSINMPGGVWCSGEPVSWIADNTKKGVSSEVTSVTVHCGPEFSKQNWFEGRNFIFNEIREHLKEIIPFRVMDYQIHKWLYSRPNYIYHKPFEYIPLPGPIYLAGDAFVSGNIEGAFLSGYKVAENILNG